MGVTGLLEGLELRDGGTSGTGSCSLPPVAPIPWARGSVGRGGGLGCPVGPGASWGCVQQLPEAEGFPPHSHPVHVKEEPAEAEDDSRPVSLMATTNQNVTIPDDRDLEEELPVEDLS